MHCLPGLTFLAVVGISVAAAAAEDLESCADKPYQVIDGAVDRATYNGFRRYNATCSHCHGPDGVGSTFGPSLIDRPLPYAEFEKVVLEGSRTGTSVMQGFAGDPNVEEHIRDMYIYLCARADGAVGRGRPKRIP